MTLGLAITLHIFKTFYVLGYFFDLQCNSVQQAQTLVSTKISVKFNYSSLSYIALALTSALTQLLFSMTFQDWKCDIQVTETLIIQDITKTKSNNNVIIRFGFKTITVLLYIVLNKITRNTDCSKEPEVI